MEYDPRKFYEVGNVVHDVDNEGYDDEYDTIKCHEDGYRFDDADIGFHCYGNSHDKNMIPESSVAMVGIG